jgi:hypothetical protein
MELRHLDNAADAKSMVPRDWARLIRKLRWIGMEEEAKRLELVVSTLPPETRGDVDFGPFSTD